MDTQKSFSRLAQNAVEKKSDDYKHSENSAKNWLDTIKDAMKQYNDAENNADDDCGMCGLLDAVETRIQEIPLSVMVRGGWCIAGDECPYEEFEILLGTGGPAVRIRGTLNQQLEPETAELQHQDWGTPWTPLRLSSDDEAILVSFSQRFYFGK